MDRRTCSHRLAASETAEAHRDRVRITRHYFDIAGLETELSGADLSQQRFSTLAHRHCAGSDQHLSRPADPYHARFERSPPRSFEPIGNAEPNVAPLGQFRLLTGEKIARPDGL